LLARGHQPSRSYDRRFDVGLTLIPGQGSSIEQRESLTVMITMPDDKLEPRLAIRVGSTQR
jgi:hypothetical protein